MKGLIKKFKWYDKETNNKKIEQELKKKCRALSSYAEKNGIGYLDLTFFFGYISICAKENSDSKEWIVDTHAFREECENE